ncbi:MAG: hypothetical protein ACM362_04260, partial [Candidatus Methylomirabilota bacterium]
GRIPLAAGALQRPDDVIDLGNGSRHNPSVVASNLAKYPGAPGGSGLWREFLSHHRASLGKHRPCRKRADYSTVRREVKGGCGFSSRARHGA